MVPPQQAALVLGCGVTVEAANLVEKPRLVEIDELVRAVLVAREGRNVGQVEKADGSELLVNLGHDDSLLRGKVDGWELEVGLGDRGVHGHCGR